MGWVNPFVITVVCEELPNGNLQAVLPGAWEMNAWLADQGLCRGHDCEHIRCRTVRQLAKHVQLATLDYKTIERLDRGPKWPDGPSREYLIADIAKSLDCTLDAAIDYGLDQLGGDETMRTFTSWVTGEVGRLHDLIIGLEPRRGRPRKAA